MRMSTAVSTTASAGAGGGGGGSRTHHALEFVAAGRRSCVVRDYLDCESEVRLSGGGGGGGGEVSKLQADSTAPGVEKLRSIVDALSAADPSAQFTVSPSSTCTITAEARERLVRDGACKQLRTDISEGKYGGLPAVRQTRMRGGQPLAQFLASPGITLVTVLELMFQVCAGAQTLHERELAHGNLCLENLVYFPDDARVRMIDFESMFSYSLEVPLKARDTGYGARALKQLNGDEKRLLARFDRQPSLRFNEMLVNFPPDSILLQTGGGFDDLDQMSARLEDFATELAREDMNGGLLYPPIWNESLAELKVQCEFLDESERLQHFQPDKFSIYQLGFLLLSVLSHKFCSSRASFATQLAKVDSTLLQQLRKLVTWMLMPQSESRPRFGAVLDTMYECILKLQPPPPPPLPLPLPPTTMRMSPLKVKNRAAMKKEPPPVAAVRSFINPTADQYVFWFSTGPLSSFKDKMGTTELIASMRGRADLCRTDVPYFSSYVHGALSQPHFAASLWVLHWDSEAARSRVAPHIDLVLALAFVKVDTDDEPEILRVQYLCATRGSPPGSGHVLFRTLAAHAASMGFERIKLHAASKEAANIYRKNYHMDCKPLPLLLDSYIECTLLLDDLPRKEVMEGTSTKVTTAPDVVDLVEDDAPMPPPPPPNIAAAALAAAADKKRKKEESDAAEYDPDTQLAIQLSLAPPPSRRRRRVDK